MEASTIEHLEETLWERLLRMVDANGDNQMQKDEFKKLMQMLGNEFSEQELDMMYAKADSNSDGDVTGTELAKYITKVRKEFGLKFLRQVVTFRAEGKSPAAPTDGLIAGFAVSCYRVGPSRGVRLCQHCLHSSCDGQRNRRVPAGDPPPLPFLLGRRELRTFADFDRVVEARFAAHIQGGYKTADEASRSWMFKLSE